MKKYNEQEAMKLEAYLKFYAEYFSQKNRTGRNTDRKETLELPALPQHKTK